MARSICSPNQVLIDAVISDDDTAYCAKVGIAATSSSANTNFRFRCEPSVPLRRSKTSFTRWRPIRYASSTIRTTLRAFRNRKSELSAKGSAAGRLPIWLSTTSTAANAASTPTVSRRSRRRRRRSASGIRGGLPGGGASLACAAFGSFGMVFV